MVERYQLIGSLPRLRLFSAAVSGVAGMGLLRSGT